MKTRVLIGIVFSICHEQPNLNTCGITLDISLSEEDLWSVAIQYLARKMSVRNIEPYHISFVTRNTKSVHKKAHPAYQPFWCHCTPLFGLRLQVTVLIQKFGCFHAWRRCEYHPSVITTIIVSNILGEWAAMALHCCRHCFFSPNVYFVSFHLFVCHRHHHATTTKSHWPVINVPIWTRALTALWCTPEQFYLA